MTAPSEQTRAVRSPQAVIVFFVVALGLLAADLVVKQLAFAHVAGTPVLLDGPDASGRAAIPPHDSRILVPKVLALHLTVNEGAVFGLGQGGRWSTLR